MNHLLSQKYYQKIGKHVIYWNIIKNDKIKEDGIFTMSFYRKEGYESNSPQFLVYKDGLKNTIKSIYSINKKLKSGTWKIRIYYEESVQNDINEIMKENIEYIDYFELFKYEFPLFLNENKMHHYKSFGMFMRLLPFFKDTNNNDLLIGNAKNIKHYHKRVLNIDIDQKLKYNIFEFIKDLYKNKVEFGYRTHEGYNLYQQIQAYKVINSNKLLNFWSIINCFIYQYNIYYPYELFVDFFEKSVSEWLTNNRNTKYKDYNMSIFGYGYDEFFTNNYMLNYYLNKKVSIKILLKPHYFTIFFGLISFICEYVKLVNDKVIKLYIKNILKLFYFNKYVKNKSNNIRNQENYIKLLSNEIKDLKGVKSFHDSLYSLFGKAYLINENNKSKSINKSINKSMNKSINKNMNKSKSVSKNMNKSGSMGKSIAKSIQDIKEKGPFFKKIFNYIKKIFYRKKENKNEKIKNKDIELIINHEKTDVNGSSNITKFPHTKFLNIINNIQLYINYKYNIDYPFNLLKSINMMKLLVPLGVKNNNLNNLLDKSYIISNGNKNIKLIKIMKNCNKKVIPIHF